MKFEYLKKEYEEKYHFDEIKKRENKGINVGCMECGNNFLIENKYTKKIDNIIEKINSSSTEYSKGYIDALNYIKSIL